MRRSDVALAVGTAVVVSAAALAGVSSQRTPGPGTFVFAAGFGALLLLRRRRPVGVLLVSGAGLLAYYALGFPPIGLALPVGAALYSAAEAGRLRWAAGTAAALIVVSTVARALTGETTSYLLGYDLPITVAVMGAAIAAGDGVRSRRRFRQAVLAAAATDREHRIEQERLRVARDVHDVLAHTMSVVSLHADVAAESLDDGDPAAVRAALGHIRAASSDAGAGAAAHGRAAAAIPARGWPASRSWPRSAARPGCRCGSGPRARAGVAGRGGPGRVPGGAGSGDQRPPARPPGPGGRAARLHRPGSAGGGQRRRAGLGRGVRRRAGPDRDAERVTLLGGTLDAGRSARRGFRVEAVLPA